MEFVEFGMYRNFFKLTINARTLLHEQCSLLITLKKKLQTFF